MFVTAPARVANMANFGLHVSRIEQRISEAEKLGFKRIFVPLGNKKGFTRKATHIEVAFVSRIADICRSLFG